MLTLAYLIVEAWRVLWRPRATVVRKSSFNTLKKTERPIVTKRQPKDLSESPQSEILPSWRDDLPPVPDSPNSPPKSPKSPRQKEQSGSFSTADDRKVVVRGIPVASKHIVPSVLKPTQSEIQAQTAPAYQASPPQTVPDTEQQKHHHQHSQPSHIPTPIQKSVKTLVLEPSVSGNRMDETWAKKQLDKFSFGFDEADKDKSGSLSFDEVHAVLLHHGFKGSKAEAEFIFDQLDKDGSKTVSKSEFDRAMKKVPRMIIREFVYRKAFKQMDKDNSGFLTKTEIADATKNEGGITIGAKVVSDLLCYISKADEDEKVDYEEFLRVFGIDATASVMYQTFKSLDKDGSGFLTRDEMINGVTSENELSHSAKLISELLIDLVKDNTTKMNYDEFVKSYLKRKQKK